jgi:hypothetical protein
MQIGQVPLFGLGCPLPVNQPRAGIVDRFPIELQPLADFAKLLLLVLRDRSIGLRCDIEQEASVLAAYLVMNEGLKYE